MATSVIRRGTAALSGKSLNVAWYAAGAVFAFLVPFIFSSTLNLQHDVYYMVYFAAVGAFLAAYVNATGADVVGCLRRNLGWSLGLGVLSAAFVVFNVLGREDSTPHPSGGYFVSEIVWRGLAYGVIDALLLTAFPVLVGYALLEGRIDTFARRGLYATVTLALVLVITATYHLGYEQFREDGVGAPETGNTIISIPALASANPVGSIIAHASMHVAAVTHAYETDVFLPPQTDVESSRQ